MTVHVGERAAMQRRAKGEVHPWYGAMQRKEEEMKHNTTLVVAESPGPGMHPWYDAMQRRKAKQEPEIVEAEERGGEKKTVKVEEVKEASPFAKNVAPSQETKKRLAGAAAQESPPDTNKSTKESAGTSGSAVVMAPQQAKAEGKIVPDLKAAAQEEDKDGSTAKSDFSKNLADKIAAIKADPPKPDFSKNLAGKIAAIKADPPVPNDACTCVHREGKKVCHGHCNTA